MKKLHILIVSITVLSLTCFSFINKVNEENKSAYATLYIGTGLKNIPVTIMYGSGEKESLDPASDGAFNTKRAMDLATYFNILDSKGYEYVDYSGMGPHGGGIYVFKRKR